MLHPLCFFFLFVFFVQHLAPGMCGKQDSDSPEVIAARQLALLDCAAKASLLTQGGSEGSETRHGARVGNGSETTMETQDDSATDSDDAETSQWRTPKPESAARLAGPGKEVRRARREPGRSWKRSMVRSSVRVWEL